MFFLLRAAHTRRQWFAGGRLEDTWQEPTGVRGRAGRHAEGPSMWDPGVQTVPWELGEPGGRLVCLSSGFFPGKWDKTLLTGLIKQVLGSWIPCSQCLLAHYHPLQGSTACLWRRHFPNARGCAHPRDRPWEGGLHPWNTEPSA